MERDGRRSTLEDSDADHRVAHLRKGVEGDAVTRPSKNASHAEYVAWCTAQLVEYVPAWSDAELLAEARCAFVPAIAGAVRAEMQRRGVAA